MDTIITILMSVGMLALFFVFLSVRILVKKNGEFKGTCASQNPYLSKEGRTCGYCGRTVTPGEPCGNPDSEVHKTLAKF